MFTTLDKLDYLEADLTTPIHTNMFGEICLVLNGKRLYLKDLGTRYGVLVKAGSQV